jgi:autotransporter-associated beta strand protein
MATPHLVASTGHFLKYGANGFEPMPFDIAAGDVATLNTSTSNTLTKVTATLTLNQDVPAFALRFDNGKGTGSSAYNFLIGSGGLIYSGTAADASIYNPIDFGAAEGVVAVLGTGRTLYIHTGISGSGGLTKTGPGTLFLKKYVNQPFTGDIVVNEGKLDAFYSESYGPVGNKVVLNGGSWDASGQTQRFQIAISSRR